MSKLEDLVPELELCRKIPAGKFENSVFVWWTDGYGTIVIKRIDAPYEYGIDAPSPTLQEIMVKLPGFVEYRWLDALFEAYHPDYYPEDFFDSNPVTAALKLWLELNKKETAK